MAEEKKKAGAAAATTPEESSHGKTAPHAPTEKSPPGKTAMYALAAFVVLILIGAAYFYLQQSQGEKEIPLSEFRAKLNITTRAAVVQDLRAVPADAVQARSALQNCGVQLSYSLSNLGKNVTNYALEGDTCTYVSGSEIQTKTVQECLSSIRSENRLLFSISYNTTANKTVLFPSSAQFYGDENFLSSCAISTTFGSS